MYNIEMLYQFMLAMNVLEFLYIIFYVVLVSYIFQLPDIYCIYCMLFTYAECLLITKVHARRLPIVLYDLLNFNASKYRSMACSYWFVWSLQICCYHQKEDFEKVTEVFFMPSLECQQSTS